LEDGLIQKVYQYMMDNDMLAGGRHIIVGVSGGADSMCLLFALLTLRKQLGITLSVVHINHGLRGTDADEDEKFVESVCREQEITFRSFHVDISAYAKRMKMSEEEAGRHYRYKCFDEVLDAACKDKIADGRIADGRIAIAHNRDDLSETVLFNIFRGTGIRGLKGIPCKRGRIIRPLLGVSRKEIEDFLDRHSLGYRTDQTNFAEDYARNRIRLKILPYVEKHINYQAKNHLYQLAAMASDVEGFILEQTDNVYGVVVQDDHKILIAAFSSLNIVLKREIVRRMIFKVSEKLKDISFSHIEAVINLVDQQVGKQVQLPDGLTAIRRYDVIEICAEALGDLGYSLMNPIDVIIPGTFNLPGKKISFAIKNLEENERIPEKLYTKWFDYDKIKVGLKLRNRLQGDYFIIEKGNKKMLTRYMIDQKIPKESRDQMILLADGSHVIWLIDGRISEAYKITPQTKRILVVKIREFKHGR